MKTARLYLAVALIVMPAFARQAVSQSVQLELLSGATEQGKLVKLLPEKVALQKEGQGEVQIPLADILTIQFSDAPKISPLPTIQVELTDGSQLRGDGFQIDKQGAHLILRDNTSFSVPIGQIRSVRFQAPTESTDEQWGEIRESSHEGDTIVLRKKNGALDFLDGAIGDVTEDKVSFRFDETARQVSRAKLEGLLIYHPQSQKHPDAIATVIDTWGGRWQVQEMDANDNGMRITLSGGVKQTLPWNGIARIDYGAAKILFLGDIEPVRLSWTPFIQATTAKAALKRLFRPRRNRSLDGHELSLYFPSSRTTTTYARGLAIPSRTEIEYQLTAPYKRLQAIAGINSRMRRLGDIQLRIRADGRTILDIPIRGGDEPTRLDLDISGARRISFVVDYGQNLDIADHLNLCDLRVIK